MTGQAVHFNMNAHLFSAHWQSFNNSFINEGRGNIKAFATNALLFIWYLTDMGYVNSRFVLRAVELVSSDSLSVLKNADWHKNSLFW